MIGLRFLVHARHHDNALLGIMWYTYSRLVRWAIPWVEALCFALFATAVRVLLLTRPCPSDI